MTDKSQSGSEDVAEKAEAALSALKSGKISAAAATATASLLRVQLDRRVQGLQAQLAEALEYAASLEAQLKAMGVRGVR